MTGSRVALAYIYDTQPSYSWHDSITGLYLYDLSNSGHLYGGEGPIKMRCSRVSDLPDARNRVVKRVLDSREDEWLLWVDDDMGFEPDSLDRLLAVADPDTCPVVGGLCFTQRETNPDGYSGFQTRAVCTVMDWREGPDGKQGFASRAWYEPNALTRCDGTGSAFILIHRSVLEKIRDEYGDVWYDLGRSPEGGMISEDLSFCMRCGSLDIPIHVYTGVRTTHFKHLWLSEEDFWEQATPIPATEQTAVLVPVYRRPQNAEPFMRSLRASSGLVTAYAVCDDTDTASRDAWKTAGAQIIESSGPSFATKINDGYRATNEPWLFVVGDDVQFWPGWLDHAQYAAAITGADVIGTNDLGNPRVMRGEHATHLLIRRSYVDECGASWDPPGVVCHEGYRHWYVDDELVAAAKQRHVWSMALASRVEHLHPLWKKADYDETYRVGQTYAEKDRKLFQKRLAQFGDD